jgi:GT2 family glycosyltransferase
MLSIVILTLNEEKFLPHLLKSLKEQTFKDFEIVAPYCIWPDTQTYLIINLGISIENKQ